MNRTRMDADLEDMSGYIGEKMMLIIRITIKL